MVCQSLSTFLSHKYITEIIKKHDTFALVAKTKICQRNFNNHTLSLQRNLVDT